MFIEALGAATLGNGVLRIETKIRAGDQLVPNGYLVIPAGSAGPVASQLVTILTELKTRIDQLQAETKDKEASA